jgi:hypothetical protein
VISFLRRQIAPYVKAHGLLLTTTGTPTEVSIADVKAIPKAYKKLVKKSFDNINKACWSNVVTYDYIFPIHNVIMSSSPLFRFPIALMS